MLAHLNLVIHFHKDKKMIVLNYREGWNTIQTKKHFKGIIMNINTSVYSKKRAFVLVLGVLLLCMPSTILADIPPESGWMEEGVCARVRIRIEQEVAITRSAFQATLEIANSPENVPLENLNVTLDIQNTDDQFSNNLFGIKGPTLTGIGDISGNGILSPDASAKAVWTLIPTRDAAPEYPTQYYVGGNISYTEGENEVNMPLFPASITVIPDPRLELDYFLQRVVYSDDPFTKDIIEPAEPYPLGLIFKNTGKGTAYDVNITSSQPEIIENEKGLLIDFEIIGTRVNTEQVTPSLTVNLGDIGPGETSVAQWIMKTSLAGKFIDYQAEFEHVDGLGDPRLSIIDRVDIHDVIHAVRMDYPDDDQKPDFLANDIEDPDYLPDKLYSSDGSTAPVNVIQDPAISGEINSDNLQVTLTANPPSGWVYIRAQDPGEEAFVLKQVIRSDGKEIMVDENAWTTHRTIRLVNQPTVRQHLLHILDYTEGGSYQYTLVYESLLATPEPPNMMFIPDRIFLEGTDFGFIVKASDPNGTTPSISASPIPGGASFTDHGNGEAKFEWATSVGDAGKYEMIFTASDGELASSQNATIAVYSAEDTDGDGMPDEWEMEQFGTLNRDGSGDFDGDGMSDLDEYLNNIGILLDAYELTVEIEPVGSGTVKPSAGSHFYPDGGVVRIEASPENGYRFDYWSGDVADPDSLSTTVKMNQPRTVTAHFIGPYNPPVSEMPGDIDNNGTVNLTDAIYALQIISGINSLNIIYEACDVNDDGKVGIEEAIYILRLVQYRN